jgi:hypothetical protein
MAIARIITSMPELSGGLVRDLNSRGFEVHILSPEQTITGDADLEIRLDVAGSRQSMAQVYASNSLVMQTETAGSKEDIWAMLAAYDGDAEKIAVKEDTPEEIISALLDQNALQEPVGVAQSMTAENAERSPEQNAPARPEENLIAPGIVWEEIVEAAEAPEAENAVSVSAVEPVSHEAISNQPEHEIDPELVPSMFHLAASSVASDAPVEGPAPVEAQKEEKPYLDGNDFRNLVAKKNGSWNFRAPKVAIVGWAAVALLLLVSFMHRHTSVPPDANAAQVPFHASTITSSASVMPVKAVMMTNTGVPIKTNRKTASDTADIAEDTIVHYNGKAKTHALESEKHTAVKFYTDMD